MTPAHEIKRPYESSLVTEKGSVDVVRGGAVFWCGLDGGKKVGYGMRHLLDDCTLPQVEAGYRHDRVVRVRGD